MPSANNRVRTVVFVENGIGYGGAVVCMRYLVRALDRSRFRPVVVTGRRGGPYEALADDAEWHCFRDQRLDVDRLRAALQRRGLIGRRRLLDAIAGQVLARLDDLFNFLPCFLQTLWFLLRRRPALVHVNNEPLCNRAAILAAALLRIPVVAHVRGELQGSWLMRRLYRLPRRFIPVSQWVGENIARLGVDRGRITQSYDGLELTRLDVGADGRVWRERFGLPADAFLVGLVGLLIPWKGQQLFLDALERLMPGVPNLYGLMIGGTPDECAAYEDGLRERVGTLPWRERVVFTGHVANLSATYNALDIVLSASTSPEPLGTVVIEGLALGRAVVAPRHGGALEMIEDGRTGFLFEPGSAEDLARVIDRLYRDPALRSSVGAAARLSALQRFSIDKHAAEVQAVYEQVLDGGRPTPTSQALTAR